MKHKILVIEDNKDVRENIAEILGLSGYQVRTACDGMEGVSEARAWIPDLILCDIMMPKLDGYGVLKILSEDPDFNRKPFIFLSAKTEIDDIRRGMGIGADDYITKPFDDLSLLEALEVRLRKYTDNQNIKHDTLLSSSKFSKAFDVLLQRTEERSFVEKDIVYEHGKNPHWIFYLESGMVKHQYKNDLGKEIILEIWKEGVIFGIEAPFMENVYYGSAVVLRDSVIRMIPIEKFKEAVKTDPNMSNHIINIICNRKRRYAYSLGSLAYSSVRRKVADSLLYFAELFGGNEIDITRDDLAARATTAKETVIRTLSDFKSDGIITTHKSQIVIVDSDALRNMPT